MFKFIPRREKQKPERSQTRMTTIRAMGEEMLLYKELLKNLDLYSLKSRRVRKYSKRRLKTTTRTEKAD